jgi:hypothetical protein
VGIAQGISERISCKAEWAGGIEEKRKTKGEVNYAEMDERKGG